MTARLTIALAACVAALVLAGCLKLPEREPKDATVLAAVLDASVETEHRCYELAARISSTLFDSFAGRSLPRPIS